MTAPDPYVPGHGDDSFSVARYDLDLHYRHEGNHLEARAAITLHAAVDAPAIELDLYRLRVRSLSVEGAVVARWTHRGSRVRVRFREEVPAGTQLTLHLTYSGNPQPMPGPDGRAGWEELADGVIVAAQPHGAPSWFPCNDRMSDKATYRVAVTTDPEYHVVGNGTPVERQRVGRWMRTVHEDPHPMAPYLATLQIGRYRSERLTFEGVETWVACPPQLLEHARLTLADQPRMMELFEDLFGPYPFEAYTVVVTDDVLEIPLESQSLSTFGRNHLTRSWEAQRLIAHELAHQWFGNTVTAASLADIWLHEGFACYAEWLWSQETGIATTEEQARKHHALLADEPQDLLLTDPGPKLAFDDRVYKRGALALHATRTTLGDAAFFALLRDWVDEHRHGLVTTADFEDAVRRVGGDAALAVLHPWLHEVALPALP